MAPLYTYLVFNLIKCLLYFMDEKGERPNALPRSESLTQRDEAVQ